MNLTVEPLGLLVHSQVHSDRYITHEYCKRFNVYKCATKGKSKMELGYNEIIHKFTKIF